MGHPQPCCASPPRAGGEWVFRTGTSAFGCSGATNPGRKGRDEAGASFHGAPPDGDGVFPRGAGAGKDVCEGI